MATPAKRLRLSSLPRVVRTKRLSMPMIRRYLRKWRRLPRFAPTPSATPEDHVPLSSDYSAIGQPLLTLPGSPSYGACLSTPPATRSIENIVSVLIADSTEQALHQLRSWSSFIILGLFVLGAALIGAAAFVALGKTGNSSGGLVGLLLLFGFGVITSAIALLSATWTLSLYCNEVRGRCGPCGTPALRLDC